LGEIWRIARHLGPGVDMAARLEVRKGQAGVQPAKKEKGNINALLELAMLNEASRATRHWQIPRT